LHFEGDNSLADAESQDNGVPNDGNDSLTINNVRVTNPDYYSYSLIEMNGGNDSATINKFVDRDLQLTMGDGNDKLNMTNSTFVGGAFKQLNIDTGDGDDTATLKNDRTGPLTVNVGFGDNAINVTQCTAATASLLGVGSLAGTGNNFATTPTVSPAFSHL